MFFDSFFDAISPGKIKAIVKPLILPIWKRVKEIDQIFIWNKTIELSGSDNGIVATGYFYRHLGEGIHSLAEVRVPTEYIDSCRIIKQRKHG